MNNPNLGRDYRLRARGRKVAIDALFTAALYADVVRECQESCELALKSLIREAGHSVPMVHEVSQKLREIRNDLPSEAQAQLDRLCEVSKQLRRDRELSFCGSEDLTPSEFYSKDDALRAMGMLDEVLACLPA